MRWRGVFVVAVVATILAACAGSAVESRQREVLAQFTELKQALGEGEILYAEIAEGYADWVIKNRPDQAPLARSVQAMAKGQGPELRKIGAEIRSLESAYDSNNARLEALNQAESELRSYERKLIDAANALAGLSGGELGRIKPLEQMDQADLVGNPAFGEHRTDASGNSFWAWYGQYAMFSALVGGFGDMSEARRRHGGHYARIPKDYRAHNSATKDVVRHNPSSYSRASASGTGTKAANPFASTYSRARASATPVSARSSSSASASSYSNTRDSSRTVSRRSGGFGGK